MRSDHVQAWVGLLCVGCALGAGEAFAHHGGTHDERNYFHPSEAAAWQACVADNDAHFNGTPCSNVQAWCYRVGSAEVAGFAFVCNYGDSAGNAVLGRYHWYPTTPCPAGQTFVGPPGRCEGPQCNPAQPQTCSCPDPQAADELADFETGFRINTDCPSPLSGEAGVVFAAMLSGSRTPASCHNDCQSEAEQQGGGSVTVDLCIGGSLSIEIEGESSEQGRYALACNASTCEQLCDFSRGCVDSTTAMSGDFSKTIPGKWKPSAKLGRTYLSVECETELGLFASGGVQKTIRAPVGDAEDCAPCVTSGADFTVGGSVEGSCQGALNVLGRRIPLAWDDAVSGSLSATVAGRTPPGECGGRECAELQLQAGFQLRSPKVCSSLFGYVLSAALSGGTEVVASIDSCGGEPSAQITNQFTAHIGYTEGCGDATASGVSP